MSDYSLSRLSFHNNNLTEIEILLNKTIKEEGKVSISFFTGGFGVAFKEVREIRIGHWNDYTRFELIKTNGVVGSNDIEVFDIVEKDFVYKIMTGSGGRAGEESNFIISFHEATYDNLKEFYKKSYGGELLSKYI